MDQLVSYLIERLRAASENTANVIPWSSPVPSFGDALQSRVATVGINPSNKEFVDDQDEELADQRRRFHTLRSLGLSTWAQADDSHHREIALSCAGYFQANPYDRWFKALDFIISGTRFSYYSSKQRACHLDLVPFATSCKWSALSNEHRSHLLAIGGDALGRIVRDSPVRILVLNGSSVVSQFQKLCDTALVSTHKPTWELPRPRGAGVAGYSYRGSITTLAGVRLGRPVAVLGYNHNIQSSFGVTREVKSSIRRWVSKQAEEFIS